MSHAREAAVDVMVVMVFCSVLCSATEAASPIADGVAQAPSQSQTGGSEYAAPGRLAQAPRPVLSALRSPTSATAGPPPKVTLRLQEQGVGTVYLQVKVINLATHHSSLVATMGWSHTGRTLTVAWPAGSLLAAGSYLLSVSAHDHHGRTLLLGAHGSGEASLTVTAAAPPIPKPALPAPAPTTPGAPTPAQTVADGAVFPVAGAHNFGGPENVFGAPRNGYLHQGQDILTAEGTPVLAPLAGTILTTSYQAEGAGYYVVEQTGIGFDFMFAHCEASSLAVSTGQAVTPGQALCRAGQTGDATAPHLDFEIWVGGWQAPGGEPIDPLPYLQAWEAA